MKFSDLGVTTDVVVGKGIEMDELFGQHILIEKTIIKPTNFPGKIQVVCVCKCKYVSQLGCRTGLGKKEKTEIRKGKDDLVLQDQTF